MKSRPRDRPIFRRRIYFVYPQQRVRIATELHRRNNRPPHRLDLYNTCAYRNIDLVIILLYTVSGNFTTEEQNYIYGKFQHFGCNAKGEYFVIIQYQLFLWTS